LVTLASCTERGRPAEPDAPVPAGLASALRGETAYLLIGPPGSANVWRVDAAHPKGEQLTDNKGAFGVSWISASPAGLVLADARSSIDVVSVYRDHASQPLPAGHGGTPSVNADGQIAFVQVPDVVNRTGPQTFRISVTSTGGEPPQVRYQQATDMGALAWGPGNQLAVISAPGPRKGQGRPEVLVINGSGTVMTRLRPSIGEIGFLSWNAAAPGIAVGGMTDRSEIVTTDGRETPLPRGWRPLCWSPDGSKLLVGRDTEAGVWRPGASDRVDSLGKTGGSGPLLGCAWLTRPADRA
jgi:hypothetical protein